MALQMDQYYPGRSKISPTTFPARSFRLVAHIVVILGTLPLCWKLSGAHHSAGSLCKSSRKSPESVRGLGTVTPHIWSLEVFPIVEYRNGFQYIRLDAFQN